MKGEVSMGKQEAVGVSTDPLENKLYETQRL